MADTTRRLVKIQSYIKSFLSLSAPSRLSHQPAQDVSIKECPKCGSQNTRRVHRALWMHFVPSRIRIWCYDCGQRSLVSRKRN